MEVQFSPDEQAKLVRIAESQGVPTESVVKEAVTRFLDHEEWFSREVDKGLAAADNGEFVEDSDVFNRINSRYPVR